MKNLYKVLALKNEQRKKYFDRPLFYGEKLKSSAQKLFPDVKVFLFGSVVKEKCRPDSDFDVLVVTEKVPANIFQQVRAKMEIVKDFPNHPFELHLVTPEQFENWYQRFVKTNYLKI